MTLDHYGRITSLVVSRRGEVVHEQYLDGEENSLRNTRSCTKTVLGVLVGIAIERHVMRGVDVTLGELLKGRPMDTTKAAITVEQLLTMQSPLACNDSDEMSPGNGDLMYPTRDWGQFALDLPLRRDAGFSYCTAGVVLLGIVVAAALGERLSAFARRELFSAAGIDRFDWPITPLARTQRQEACC